MSDVPISDDAAMAVGSTAWLERRVKAWLDTWAPHCGASRAVFEDFREGRTPLALMLITHKLEGMHYAALTEVRRELQLRSRSSASLG